MVHRAQHMRTAPRRLIALACALACGGAYAVNARASFQVNIEVRRTPPARCTSATLSAATHAEVQVVCATGQFVTIEATSGRPFLGTHGAAFRYVLDAGGVVPSNLLLNADLGGTVTSL